MSKYSRISSRVACLGYCLLSIPVNAQTAPTDLMVVFDGSGSMWGELEGRTKIETARDVLGGVLENADPTQSIGLIAYGHREKGNCGDIETLVGLGPAQDTVPEIISATQSLNPKGKTPLSEAVSQAAKALRFTENAATVVLITDGLETCDADPCAVGRQLEAEGLDFTTHVIGFGLQNEDKAELVCLAEETGGMFLSADTADTLTQALGETVPAKAEPAANIRDVHFLFRDSEDSEILSTRHLEMTLLTEAGDAVDPDSYTLNYTEVSDTSGKARLAPGSYVAKLVRKSSNGEYETDYAVDVPEGEGVHVVEAVLAGRLLIKPFINPRTPFDPSEPPASAVRQKAWAYFHILPIDETGEIGEVLHEKYQNLDFRLPAGTYRVRGNLSRTTSAERDVEIAPGETVTLDFSFDATPVSFISVSDNAPVETQTTYIYNGVREGRNHFVSASGRSGPFYLPTGRFLVNLGAEGGGERRSEIIADVSGDYKPILVTVGEGQSVDAEVMENIKTNPPCKEILKVKYKGCRIAAYGMILPEDGSLPPPDIQSAGQQDQSANLRVLSFKKSEADMLQARLYIDDVSETIRLELDDGWCEDLWTCQAETISIEWDRADLLTGDRQSLGTIRNDVVGLSAENRGERKILYINEKGNGGRPQVVLEQVVD